MYKAEVTLTGTGDTEDEAIDNLIGNLFETHRLAEFKSGGTDCFEITQHKQPDN